MPLRRGPDLGQRFPLLKPPLLPQAHDLEAVKVCQALPPLNLLPVFEPVGLLPLRLHAALLPELLDCAGTGTAWEFLDDDLRQEAVGERDWLSRDGQLGV